MLRIGRIGRVCLLAASSLVLAAVLASGQEALERYTDKSEHFSIEFPKGWKIQEIPGKGVGALDMKGARGGVADNINVWVEAVPAGMSTDAYSEISLQNLKKALPTAESKKGSFTIDGEAGVKLVTTFEMQGVKATSTQYCLLKNGKAYVITGTTLAQNADRMQPLFDKVAESFTVEGAAPAEAQPAEAANPLAPTPLEGDNFYRNAEKGLSVQFPADWKLETPKKGPLVMATRPQENNKDFFLDSVTVASRKLSSETTAAQYRDRSIERAQKSSPGMTPMDTGTGTIGGADAAWFAYSLRAMMTETKGITYFLLKDERVVTINCTSSPDTFEKYRPTFEAIASSVKIGEGAATASAAPEMPAASPAGFYEDKARFFSIVFPADWAVNTRGMAYAVSAVSPREGEADPFCEQLSVTVDTSGRMSSPEAFEKDYIAGLKRKSLTFKVVESGPIETGGKTGRYVVHTINMASLPFKNITYIFAKGSRVYLLVGQGIESSFDRHKPFFDEAAKSLKLEEEPPKK